jgi:hypothetical protein
MFEECSGRGANRLLDMTPSIRRWCLFGLRSNCPFLIEKLGIPIVDKSFGGQKPQLLKPPNRHFLLGNGGETEIKLAPVDILGTEDSRFYCA